jgi:hypothetical protein
VHRYRGMLYLLQQQANKTGQGKHHSYNQNAQNSDTTSNM